MTLSKSLCAGTWPAFSFIALAQTKPDTQKTQRPIVILVTIDGFPARALNADLPMPTLLGLARSGAVSDEMIPVNPTVTWPNHTTLVTGVDASRHHVLANGRMELSEDSAVAVRPEADKSVLMHGQTLYDVAAEHGLVAGQTDWVAGAGAKNITWQFPVKPTMDSAVVQEMIHDKRLTEDDTRTQVRRCRRCLSLPEQLSSQAPAFPSSRTCRWLRRSPASSESHCPMQRAHRSLRSFANSFGR